ncbi:unnamed protein product [Calicophoron daubneyi]|uniref:C2H2-type domain-containing protein n=1 Tax=Calicophoron daubneyi TaxID=300641 RepID=A0AAV2T5Z7_CALDB
MERLENAEAPGSAKPPQLNSNNEWNEPFNRTTIFPFGRASSTPRRPQFFDHRRGTLAHSNILFFDQPPGSGEADKKSEGQDKSSSFFPQAANGPHFMLNPDEMLSEVDRNVAEAGTVISSSPPPTASFSPPSELSEHSSNDWRLVNELQLPPVCPLDLRVNRNRQDANECMDTSSSSAVGPHDFSIQKLLTHAKLDPPARCLDETAHHSIGKEYCSQYHVQPTPGLIPVPGDILLRAMSTLYCMMGQQSSPLQHGTHQHQISQQSFISSNAGLQNVAQKCISPQKFVRPQTFVPRTNRREDSGSLNPADESNPHNPTPVGIPINPARTYEFTDSPVAGSPEPSKHRHCFSSPVRSNVSTSLGRMRPASADRSEDDSNNKGPAIFYFPEPADSKAQIRAMLERGDPRLKFVNDGAAVRNPFAVDRKIQLTHLTALLCVKMEDGNYLCKGCNRTTSRLRPMQQHLLSHSASKFNLCVRCLKGFNDKYDMKRHTRKHTLVRPYVCPECRRSFSQRCSLEGHRRKIHKVCLNYTRNQRREIVRVCECCGFTCPNPMEMLHHMIKYHPHSTSLSRLRRQIARQEERSRRLSQASRSSDSFAVTTILTSDSPVRCTVLDSEMNDLPPVSVHAGHYDGDLSHTESVTSESSNSSDEGMGKSNCSHLQAVGT